MMLAMHVLSTISATLIQFLVGEKAHLQKTQAENGRDPDLARQFHGQAENGRHGDGKNVKITDDVEDASRPRERSIRHAMARQRAIPRLLNWGAVEDGAEKAHDVEDGDREHTEPDQPSDRPVDSEEGGCSPVECRA